MESVMQKEKNNEKSHGGSESSNGTKKENENTSREKNVGRGLGRGGGKGRRDGTGGGRGRGGGGKGGRCKWLSCFLIRWMAARAADENYPGVRRMVSEAKKFTTETAWDIVNSAMQIMGGSV